MLLVKAKAPSRPRKGSHLQPVSDEDVRCPKFGRMESAIAHQTVVEKQGNLFTIALPR